jgi:hypothetical protein
VFRYIGIFGGTAARSALRKLPISSFRRRPESSGFIYMPLGFVPYAKNLIVWIPACAGMTN